MLNGVCLFSKSKKDCRLGRRSPLWLTTIPDLLSMNLNFVKHGIFKWTCLVQRLEVWRAQFEKTRQR